jgi:hypothetical protein
VIAAAYCGTLSLEYKHLQQQDEMAWLEQRFESRRPLNSSQKRQVWCGCWRRLKRRGVLYSQARTGLHRVSQQWCLTRLAAGPAPLSACTQVLRWLLAAHGLESFLSRKYPASKRFGLEGCEALLPGLLALVEAAAGDGLRKVRRGSSSCMCTRARPGRIHRSLCDAGLGSCVSTRELRLAPACAPRLRLRRRTGAASACW